MLVELKARFDEQANIRWARELEQAGVHVVYGLVGLKTHCKTLLVVRQEGSMIRRYCHIGTGNYNAKTARLYEDIGMLTADPTIGADLTDLFNSLTGFARQNTYRTLLVAPYGVRRGIVRRIEEEVAHHLEGRPAGIRIKMNSLVDERVIDALYRASQAGVRVDLVVRGICALRAGVPGLSREHPRALDPRPVPGALADLPLRRRRAVLDRQRGHDAPQPGPPRRGAGAGRRPGAGGRARRRAGLRAGPGHPVLDLGPDGSWTPSPAADADVGMVRDHQVELMHRRATVE